MLGIFRDVTSADACFGRGHNSHPESTSVCVSRMNVRRTGTAVSSCVRIRQSLHFRSLLLLLHGVLCVRRVGSSLFPQRSISTTHLKTLKNCAFVDNTGHFDNEFNLAASEGLDGLNVDNIKRQKIISSSPLNVRRGVMVPLSGRPQGVAPRPSFFLLTAIPRPMHRILS